MNFVSSFNLNCQSLCLVGCHIILVMNVKGTPVINDKRRGKGITLPSIQTSLEDSW